MRVVHVSSFRGPRGAGAAELLEAWPTLVRVPAAVAARGVEVEVVQAAWRNEEAEAEGVRFYFVAEPSEGCWARRWPRGLVRRALALRPDAVHFQGLSFPLPVLLLTRASRVPVLVQDHADRVMRGFRRRVQRAGLARVAGAAFTAREQAEPFFAARVLRPGLPVFEVLECSTRFTPGDPEAARARTGVHGDPALLWVARLDGNKDPLTALEALARVLDRLPGARLWMCWSEGALEGAVRARLAAQPELAARVHLLGRVPHAGVQELCRAADFFVCGSAREGTTFALLETLASGATPLVSDIPSFRRMTGGGRVGALYPRGNAEALARLLVEWAGRPRPELRRAAREHFERHLSFDALARELCAAYEAVAAAGAR
ncbi:MAG TPA: glycosyltransferase family 4 protein [Longimicrobiaceae bacterium]|nr:glycosyltransferase family 4 protein [Longimicrobiaceae bacterium]